MTIEDNLFTALKGLCGNRMYTGFIPTAAAKPYITYSQVGGEPLSYTDNIVPNLQHGRFQFNVWGNTRAQCMALMAQIETALVTSELFQARPSSAPMTDYDHDMALHSAMCDFSIYSNR